MDESNLEAWERAALDGGNARFLSVPDEKHEFDFIKPLGIMQSRGNWISLHKNPLLSGMPDAGSPVDIEKRIPETYRHAYFLIHSERNRLKAICDLLMRNWLPELPLIVRYLREMQAGIADEELQWEAESIGIEVLPDSYRVGLLTGGSTPHFLARDLLLDLLIFICQTASQQDDFERLMSYNPLDLLEPLWAIRDTLFEDENAPAE